jgi:hypothetical protein
MSTGKSNLPKVEKFGSFSSEEQLKWIEQNIEDYEQLLFGDGYLGCSYPVESIDLNEYLENRDDYAVSGLIAYNLTNISTVRQSEIDKGAKLTAEEISALQRAIAEESEDGWTLHCGFEVTLKDGTSFALFQGHGGGQGGPTFEFEQIFKTEKSAINSISDRPFYST